MIQDESIATSQWARVKLYMHATISEALHATISEALDACYHTFVGTREALPACYHTFKDMTTQALPVCNLTGLVYKGIFTSTGLVYKGIFTS